MKAPRLFPLIPLVSVLATLLAGVASAGQPVLVRVTPEDIARLQKADPMTAMEKPGDGTPAVVPPAKDSVVRESTILHDGTYWTLVPEGAVIHMPDAQRKHINARPVGTLMPWAEFRERNASWLDTREVSFDQAAGNEKITSEQLAGWKTGGKVVVAVHQEGPIRMSLAIAGPELSQK